MRKLQDEAVSIAILKCKKEGKGHCIKNEYNTLGKFNLFTLIGTLVEDHNLMHFL